MTKERYLIIPEWMLDLGLNTSELHAYALIWGFCQDDESDYHGSASYVARWCGVRREAAVRILRKLTDMGLLIKTDEPGKPSHYSTQGCAILEGVRKSHMGCDEIAHPTCAKIAHDNKVVDNKRDNKDIQSLPRTREDLNAYGEFVRMSAENYARLVTRFGADDAARLCEILDAYLAKKPNAYRDHYRAALGWPVQRLQEEKLNQQRLKNAQEAGQRVNGQQQPYSGYGEYGLAASKRLEELLKQN
jgi:hypothetical protein